MRLEVQSLIEPISPDSPCGVDLDGTQLLAFDSYALWGKATPPSRETDWREIRDKSLQALEQSRDLRILSCLGAAVVRIDGLAAFSDVLRVADHWLSDQWDTVYPRVDEDALLRKNALNAFADRMAIVDAVRRAPFISHPQLGAFCLRDVELAHGQIAPTEKDVNPPKLSQITAAIKASSPEQLTAVSGALHAASDALRRITSIMQERADFESAPDFDPLLQPLSRIDKLLAESAAQQAGSPPSDGRKPTNGAVVPGGAAPSPPFASRSMEINSRQEAIRAIEAAATFFRVHEPSSPVPLFLDRAKRLVSKNFIEVLEDIVPESLTQAKLIGGVHDNDPAQQTQ